MKKIKTHYKMKEKQFWSLIDNEDWVGPIPDFLIDRLKKNLGIPENYELEYLESDFSECGEIVSDYVYFKFIPK